MKSRTSFFNATALKKDIVRFAPLWSIYFIGGLLVILSLLAGNQNSTTNAKDLAETIAPLSIVNMIYAALCAQVLFGDLYNSRLCNALHAMPMRREGWFLTHIFSGLVFSFVPHLVATLVMLPMLGDTWFVGFLWLAGMTLEYLFFFGLAVFSVFCAGNRLGMAAVYGILNFASMIAYWFVYTIYEPMLFGVSVVEDPFCLLSPVVQMVSNHDMLNFVPVNINTHYNATQYRLDSFGEGWGYLGICAGLGVVLMVLALLLYRRRKLEYAGDFLAVKKLEPVFTVAFTLSAGCVFAYVGQIFADYLVFLAVGLILGWLVSRMLLKRTIKVFQWKTFAWLGVFLVVLGSTMILTWMDPVGITRWVPEANAVSEVEVCFGNEIRIYANEYVKVEDPEEIEKIILGHQDIVETRGNDTSRSYRNIIFRYTLKNGTVAERTYAVYQYSVMWKALGEIYNRPDNMLGYADKETFKAAVERLFFQGDDLQYLCDKYNDSLNAESGHAKVVYSAVLDELLEAIWMDCQAGNVSQRYFTDGGEGFMEMNYADGRWREVRYTKKAVHVLAWTQKYKDIMVWIHK